MLSGHEKNFCIKKLVRGAERFHFASKQDQNPIVAARHNGYAVALIDALRDIATEDEVRSATGTSLRALRDEILVVQDQIETAAIGIYNKLVKSGVEIPGLTLGEAW